MGVVPNRLCSELRRLAGECDGNIALIFGLALPALVGLAGLGIDSAAFYRQQSRMQSVADSTALAVAQEMHLLTENFSTLHESGLARAEALLAEAGSCGAPSHHRHHVR
jgi:Flp pilus assembly protein TadG